MGDHLVCGIRDGVFQCNLLMVAKLTCEKALEKALLYELEVQNSRMLNASTLHVQFHL